METLKIWLLGKCFPAFKSQNLPSNREVLLLFFYYYQEKKILFVKLVRMLQMNLLICGAKRVLLPDKNIMLLIK